MVFIPIVIALGGTLVALPNIFAASALDMPSSKTSLVMELNVEPDSLKPMLPTLLSPMSEASMPPAFSMSLS